MSKIDIYKLAASDSEAVADYCKKQKRITKLEFAELWSKCVAGPYYTLQERVKHLYSEFGNKVTKEDKYTLAKNVLFSWYLRSLMGSNFSAKHLSFGEYGAAAIESYNFSDDEIKGKLKNEFGERPARSDKYMPIGMTYWECK